MQTPPSGPRVLLRSEQTGAELSIIQSAVPPGFTGPCPTGRFSRSRRSPPVGGPIDPQQRDEIQAIN